MRKPLALHVLLQQQLKQRMRLAPLFGRLQRQQRLISSSCSATRLLPLLLAVSSAAVMEPSRSFPLLLRLLLPPPETASQPLR